MKPTGGGKNRRLKPPRADYVNDERRTASPSADAHHQHVSTVFFSSTAQNDLDQPWFHKSTTRDEAVLQLQDVPPGYFMVRPSSQRSCYALSWKDEKNEVRHSLIYNHHPGFSLELSNSKKIWPTLTDLVKNCHFLKEGLAEKTGTPKAQQSGDDMLERLLQLVRDNDPRLQSLSWTLSVLENANNLQMRDRCERRTYISFCSEEFCAPSHFKLDASAAEAIFEALVDNTNVKTLILKGHFGFMRVNFTPHITDAVMQPLCRNLIDNRGLTHLDLSNNGIGNAGAAALADMLECNRSLQVLNLKNNFIGKDGILTLARALAKNKTLDEVVIGQQFWRHSLGSVNVSNDPFARAIVNLIEDAYIRKRELLHPFTAATTYFHGYLSKDEAEKRLEQHPNGAFLLYLNQHLPSAVMMCFKNSNMHANDPLRPFIILHKAIYRVDYGYSFSPQRGSILSLVESIGWYMKDDHALIKAAEDAGLLHEDIRDKFQPVWDFHHLWGIRAIPTPEEGQSFSSGAFPSLHQVVSRNRSFLVIPVPRPASQTISQSTTSPPAESSEHLSLNVMYKCKISN